MENLDNLGVMITRAQPFHLGHLSVIKKMLKQNENVLVYIGSADKQGTLRNPFSIQDRIGYVMEMIATEFKDKDFDRIRVVPISDWIGEENTTELKEWGDFLYYTTVFLTHQKKFNFYYNDDYDIKTNWFKKELWDRIDVITSCSQEDRELVSATKVRQAFRNNDTKLIELYLGRYTRSEEYLKNKYNKIYDTFII